MWILCTECHTKSVCSFETLLTRLTDIQLARRLFPKAKIHSSTNQATLDAFITKITCHSLNALNSFSSKDFSSWKLRRTNVKYIKSYFRDWRKNRWRFLHPLGNPQKCTIVNRHLCKFVVFTRNYNSFCVSPFLSCSHQLSILIRFKNVTCIFFVPNAVEVQQWDICAKI